MTVEPLGQLRAALAERYTIERELGRGGMATVYLAQDRKHHRAVAIKLLRPELTDLLGRERFLREIQIAAGLQHPNILPLYDSGAAEGLLYYVMPYVAGESLRDRMDREKQLPLEDALRICEEVADALAYAHGHGVVHRDIKPANILLAEGHALVADFGIAHAVNAAGGVQLTERGIAIGTPAYMSPEQASGQDVVDGRSDLYALGCVLYEMLAGEPPFTGRTAQAILARHLQERPPSLRVVRPTVSLAVQDVIETALAKVPADRYPTAARFVAALEAARMGRAARRRRVMRGVVIALLAVAAGAVWRLVVAPGAQLDPNKVVVFPLVDRGGGGAGEAVALMIGSALEHTEPLKWIDGWTWLDAGQRADIVRLTSAGARRIARSRGARYYVDGSVVQAGESVTVILRLNDAQGDSLVEQESVPGTANRTPQLGLQAVNRLLPRLIEPKRTIDFSGLANRRPAATASWLQGEREYRRSHFVAALEFCRRAVREDSSLAFAALRGAEAADWDNQNVDALQLVDLALAHGALLPPKYVEFARGLRAYFTGAADTAVRHFRKALAADPAWSGAWTALGEVYHHLLPQEAGLDSLAEAAFLEARRLDPDFAPPLFHLSETALRTGQLRRAETLIGEFRRAKPDSTWLIELTLMHECVRRGPEVMNWKDAAHRHPAQLMTAAKAMAAADGNLACARSGFEAVLHADSATVSDRWGALIGLHAVLVAEGRGDQARHAVDSAIAAGMRQAMGLYVVAAIAKAGMERQAAEAIATLGDRYEAASSRALWWLGVWAAHEGRAQRLDSIARILTSRASRNGDRVDQLMAEGLTAHLALLRGDTVQAIERFRSLVPVGPRADLEWGLWQPLASERLLLAELLLARDEAAAALRVAEQFDQPRPIAHLLYAPASLVVRARAARKLGLPESETRFRDRLVGLGRTDLLESIR